MKLPSAIRQQALALALILGIWCLLVVTFSGQLVFTTGFTWSDALLISLRDWYPWLLLAPAVAWLAVRYPMEREELALSIPVHIAACMLAVLACELLARPFPAPQPPFPGGPFPLRYRERAGFPGGGADRGLPPRPGAPPDSIEGVRPPAGLRAPEDRRPLLVNALVLRSRFNIPVYWIIVSMVHAFSYYRRSRERERRAVELERRLAEAKLQALRMQLQPHFLFNTLNAISTLVHKNPKAADEMIANLSELLRATLDTSEAEIPLRRELDFLDRYLEIQQARFGDRLAVEKQIDPATLDQLVPALILQPLAENAIRHGLEPQASVGKLRIEARIGGDTLYLRVQDNGSGATAPSDAPPPAGDQPHEDTRPPSGGVGLSNTRARLAELYGDRARLAFTRVPGQGSTVEIDLPAHTRSDVMSPVQAAK